MSVAHSIEVHAYPHRCASCRATYDALIAPWCHCVTADINVACPYCAACVCREGRAAIRDFWLDAPELLVDLRAEEKWRRKSERGCARADAATVLVVDDDEEIRLIAEYELQAMGFRTLTADNARRASELIVEQRPDIVLTDALMPGGDGRELCRQIKFNCPQIKVAVMTSLYTSQRYATEAHRTFRADAYLAKPIDFEKLREVLERLRPQQNKESR